MDPTLRGLTTQASLTSPKALPPTHLDKGTALWRNLYLPQHFFPALSVYLERGVSSKTSLLGSGVLEAMALIGEDHFDTLKVQTRSVCANQEEFGNLSPVGELLKQPWLRNLKSNSRPVNTRY